MPLAKVWAEVLGAIFQNGPIYTYFDHYLNPQRTYNCACGG